MNHQQIQEFNYVDIHVLTIAIGVDGATGLAAVELLLFLSGSGVLEPDLRHSSADARGDGYSV